MLGDGQEGLDCHKKALDIYGRILPPKHPHLAFTYSHLALAYEKKGDNNSSLDYYLAARSIYEEILPPEHPILVELSSNISRLQNAKGQCE